MDFMNNISGLVSYINTSGDRGKFAYPIIENILCNIEVNNNKISSSMVNIDENIKNIENELVNDENILSKIEITNLKSELKKLKKNKKILTNKMKEPKSIVDYINKCFIAKK
jgi:hypothetical protein